MSSKNLDYLTVLLERVREQVCSLEDNLDDLNDDIRHERVVVDDKTTHHYRMIKESNPIRFQKNHSSS